MNERSRDRREFGDGPVSTRAGFNAPLSHNVDASLRLLVNTVHNTEHRYVVHIVSKGVYKNGITTWSHRIYSYLM